MKNHLLSGIPTNMGLDHVGIVVPNAQMAAQFLIDVFAAEFDWEVKREPYPTAGERGWAEVFGVHADAYLAHVIMLKCGNQHLSQYIELFEWHSPDQIPLPEWHKFSAIGNSYISFTVKDIQAVMAYIKKNVLSKWKGTRFIQDPPMHFPLRGEVCTSTFLVSPWGMWIEITSWSESKKLGRVLNETEKHPLIGKSIEALPTPAMLIDLDIVDHNLKLMNERITKQYHWRIPSKAHQCPDLTAYQLKNSAAIGVVLLTLQEVQAFAKAGIDNIYLANQVANDDIEKLVIVAKQVKTLRVAVDNDDYLNELAYEVNRWEIKHPIEILIEVDVNHHRCGVNSIEAALRLAKLAKKIESESGAIIFAGITGYEGHTPILPEEDKTRETQLSHSILAKTKTALEAAGIGVKVISGGGSCNYMDCVATNILTEIQAGGGILGDLLYYHKANLDKHQHLIGTFILSEIISIPDDQSRAIGNAGFKSIGWHPFGGLPGFRDRRDLQILGLSAEHCRMTSLSGQPVNLRRGEKLVLIPGYTDAMGFLHKEVFAIRNDRVEQVWKTI